jgi:hypothetical protein
VQGSLAPPSTSPANPISGTDSIRFNLPALVRKAEIGLRFEVLVFRDAVRAWFYLADIHSSVRLRLIDPHLVHEPQLD